MFYSIHLRCNLIHVFEAQYKRLSFLQFNKSYIEAFYLERFSTKTTATLTAEQLQLQRFCLGLLVIYFCRTAFIVLHLPTITFSQPAQFGKLLLTITAWVTWNFILGAFNSVECRLHALILSSWHQRPSSHYIHSESMHIKSNSRRLLFKDYRQ